VPGEIYIGGVGVARGYLNRPELTAERFLSDPFSADPLARMYKTGDLGRWRADGTIEYLGRNDHQVKIRGFRIELGEIEAQLVRHAQVKEAVVLAREDVPGEKRLVAYVIPEEPSEVEKTPSVESLRAHLKAVLPEHMVPSAFVMLEQLPLTSNGKLDRRALPAPEFGAYVSRQYEAPQGEVEEILAGIWQGLLRVERVGRQDNFFELGGHSLLIVQVMERLRRVGLSAEIRHVFESPSLAELARVLTRKAVGEFEVPPNLIPAGCEAITPQMLPLVELEVEHIQRIVQSVPGGAANIQDIYPLTPLQEGLLFHHLLDQRSGDTYILPIALSVCSRERLEALIAALQGVIDRHDVLRTAVLWEQLPRPIQVVYRHVTLPVQDIALDRDRDPMEEVLEWVKPERQRLDLRQAPLIRLRVAADPYSEQWYVLLQIHHLTCDHLTFEAVIAEVVAHLEKRAQRLPESMPYRNHVAQALAAARAHNAERFFRRKLEEIVEPTAPFELLDVHGDGSQIGEAHEEIEPALAQRVRVQARRLGVSAATLFHAAWGLVVGCTSGRDDVVFGSVLLGRLQGSAGAQQTMGMFINTLPLRLRLQGVTAKELVEQTQRELVELLGHEQTPLAVAQRCSGIVGSAPLFSALLNYRHSVPNPDGDLGSASGIRMLAGQERTNYPITLSVDDLGEGFTLTAQTDRRIDPQRMTGYLRTAVQSLVQALEEAPQTPALALSILPQNERHQVLGLFNATQAAYSQEKLIHELFEEQVKRTPAAVAVVYEGQSLTYTELNGRANQLARYLREKGVESDQLVGICVERSLEMVVGLLGILKAGGAYVPLDPNYPTERLAYMLNDATPMVLLIQERLRERVPETAAEVIALDSEWSDIAECEEEDLDPRALQLTSRHLAYVIYTSGSTGHPKGVMVEHAGLVNFLSSMQQSPGIHATDCMLAVTTVSFDIAALEIYLPLLNGAKLILASREAASDAQQLMEMIEHFDVTVLQATPATWKLLLSGRWSGRPNLKALCGGEALSTDLSRELIGRVGILWNLYGPTETTIWSCGQRIATPDKHGFVESIGRPIANTQIYVMDSHRQLVPIGVAGEIYIGGAGVARGYLNRPELTAERFLADPFSTDPQARMYKTGDLGRWRADGSIEYLGRNDHQVKIRGFRIELGEIEAQLASHPQVKEALVLAREDVPGEKNLVAYVVGDRSAALETASKAAPEKLRNEIVSGWEAIWKETYAAESQLSGPSFTGWNSSYTGRPIPEDDMQEWLTETVERIKTLKPRNVLEIGCGLGLLLQHLAPQCSVYVGTDFSASALQKLRQWVRRREDLGHVELLQRAATELQDIRAGSFDTIVLNSVVQYFPDIEYLRAVLQEAVRLLVPGGKIFVGDVRHLGLLPMLHSAVQLGKAAATVSVEKLRKRITKAVAQEKELVIDPQFFEVLPRHFSEVSMVEVTLKRGRALNELTRYRYDVVLHIGTQVDAGVPYELLKWQTAVGSTEELEAALAERRWGAVHLSAIPNSRLARDAAAQRLIETSDERLEVGALRRQLNELQCKGVDPGKLWQCGEAYGYEVQLRCNAEDSREFFDAQLLDRARAHQVPRAALQLSDAVKPWSAYANDPLESSFRQQLIPQLREYLKGRLPEYMIPLAWVALNQLPLTPNGKLDRNALPAPQSRPDEMGEYIAPETELERTLADVWAEVLRVDQVGVQDNFFELGGHSLLGMKLIVRVAESLGVDAPVVTIFQYPTIRKLAPLVERLLADKTELEAGVI
jgi:amino acid adenylation domain-containing protein